MPKGRTATPQQAAQPSPQPQPDDGWRTQQRRSAKKKQERTPSKPEEETSHVALLHGQLKQGGAPVPVRARLLNSMPGVML
eukprot:3453483-Amphidinium_carterae.1